MVDVASAAPSAPVADQAAPVQSVEGQEAQSAGKENAEPEGKASSQSPGEKIKVKIDGKEVAISQSALKTLVEELGTTEEAFIRDFGTSASVTRKAQEVAKLRKEIEADQRNMRQLFADMKSDPEQLWKLMEELGHDPEKLSEERVWKKIQYEKMSPEARAAIAEKRRADDAEKRLKDIEASENAKKTKAEADAAEQEIETFALTALEQSGIKPDAKQMRRVAEFLESYIMANKTKPSQEYLTKKLLDARRQDFEASFSSITSDADFETFERDHKDFSNKFQAYLVKKARTSSLPSHTPSGSAPSPTKAKKPERVTIDEFFKNL